MIAIGMAMRSGQGVAMTRTARKRTASPVTTHARTATVSAIGHNAIPVGAVALLFGADRIMDSMRVTVNLLGNCVATLVVAKWEGQLDPMEPAEIEPPHAPSRVPAPPPGDEPF